VKGIQTLINRLRSWQYTLFLGILIWSLTVGWGVAYALGNSSQGKAIDYVLERYQLGQKIYLENCSSCHIAIPPAVLPSETWRQILQDPQRHYGTQLPALIKPKILLMWQYLQTYSRPVYGDEAVPYRLQNSRYFKALHPKVDLPENVRPQTCITCHPNASQFDFLTLSPKWQEDTEEN
jgi:hypothetical protein